MINTIPVFVKNLNQPFMDQEFTHTVDLKNDKDENEIISIDTGAFTTGKHVVDLSKDISLPEGYDIDSLHLLYLVKVTSIFFKEDSKLYGVSLENIQFKVNHELELCSIYLDMGVGRETFTLTAELDIKNKLLSYSSTLPFMLEILATDQNEVVLEKEVTDINDI